MKNETLGMMNLDPPAPEDLPVAGGKRTVWYWNHIHLMTYFLLMALALTFFIGGVLYLFVSLEIPDIRSISSYRPAQTSLIYDAEGKLIDRVFVENRTVVPLSRMPDLLPKAFIAAEDARFFEHSGLDAVSIARAIVHNIQKGKKGQGASTITQQVARALLLSREKTYTRKIKEAILAYRMDKMLSKEEILLIYLNHIYFGEGAYGVAAAAEVYFGKDVADLNLAECAILAGLPKAPSTYSPFKHFEQAKARQAYVLNQMAENGFVTPTQAKKAFDQTLLWAPPYRADGDSRYFAFQVRSYVEEKYGAERLASGGLTIYTTMDPTLQHQAGMAVKRGVEAWGKRHKQQSKAGLPQSALLAIDVQSGEVKAMVGGTDFFNSQFNRAVQARRQPGSSFKPFIYAAALEKGWTPASVIVDEPMKLPGETKTKFWEPKNYTDKFYGPTTLRNALVHSRNIVTIKLLMDVGISRVLSMAHDVGIRSELTNTLSLALGASGVSLLEIVNAYAVFARGGEYMEPVFVRKIVDETGNVLEEHQPARQRVLDPRTAYQVTSLLSKAVSEGTGTKASGLKTAVAGKTGTTNQNIDAWFIGFTPKLCTGVWVGYDQLKPLGKLETGGQAAAPVWKDFMEKTGDYVASADFDIPEGVTVLPMNPETGELNPVEGKISMEVFRTDNIPTPEELPVFGEGVAHGTSEDGEAFSVGGEEPLFDGLHGPN